MALYRKALPGEIGASANAVSTINTKGDLPNGKGSGDAPAAEARPAKTRKAVPTDTRSPTPVRSDRHSPGYMAEYMRQRRAAAKAAR